eukprot:gene855-953_t
MLKVAFLVCGIAAASQPCIDREEHCFSRARDVLGDGMHNIWATRQIIDSCSDENPLELFFDNPQLLLSFHPESHFYDLLQRLRRLDNADDNREAVAVRVLRESFSAYQLWSKEVFDLALDVVVCAIDGCDGAQQISVDRFSNMRDDFSARILPVLGLARKLDSGTGLSFGPSSVELIGDHAFSGGRLDTFFRLQELIESTSDPDALFQPIMDFSVILGRRNCMMQTRLLAFFYEKVIHNEQRSKVKFWYQPYTFRRYHILADVWRDFGLDKQPRKTAEIGVNNAISSQFMLRQFSNIEHFYAVDPYIGSDAIFEEATNRLSEFGDKVTQYRSLSLEAAEKVENDSLDFVFIDGDHSRKEVYNDVIAWTPKLKKGGILAGHDLFNPAFEGVYAAIQDLAGEG